MPIGRIAAVAAVATALAGCATPGRLMSYGPERADAFVEHEGSRVKIYAHPRDPMLLLQPAFGRGFHATGEAAIFLWRAVAERFVEPAGCGISAVSYLSTASWEATYVCPEGVDLRALIAEQRSALQAGAALQP